MQTGLSDYKNYHSSAFEDVSIKDILELKEGIPVILNDDYSITAVIEYYGVNIESKDTENYLRGRVLRQFSILFKDIQETRTTISFTKLFGADTQVEVPEGALEHEAERIKFFNKNVKNRSIKAERFFAMVNIYPAKSQDISKFKLAVLNTKMFLGVELKEEERILLTKAAFEDIEKRSLSIVRCIDNLKKVFNECSINYKGVISKKDLFDVLRSFTLPRDANSLESRLDENQSIRAQLFNGEKVVRSHKGFFLNGYFHRVYTLNELPEENVYLGELEKTLLSLPYEFAYTLSVTPLSKDETDKVFKSTWRKKKIQDLQWGVNEKRANKEDRDLEREENIAIENGTELARLSVTLVVKVPEYIVDEDCRTQDITFERWVDDFDHDIKTRHFKEFGRSIWQAEERGHFYFFSKSLGGIGSIFSPDSLTLETKQLDIPFLIPLTSVSRRDLRQDGISFYYHRSANDGTPGGIVRFDHFDSRLNAPNYEIFGSTGSGKSVLIQSILTSFMARRFNGASPIIRGTDIGGAVGSYEKIVEVYGGQIWKFKGRQKPNINLLGEINPEKSKPKEKHLIKVRDLLRKELSSVGVNVPEQEVEGLCRDIYSSLSNREVEDLRLKRDFSYYLKDFAEDKYGVTLDPSEELVELAKLKPGNCLPEEDDFSFIMTILDIMLSPGSSVGGAFENGSIDMDFISESLETAYIVKDDGFPTLSDYKDVIDGVVERDEGKNPSLIGISRSLANWVKSGKYPYFDLPTNVDLSAGIIIADLNDLIKNDTIDKIGAAYVSIINKIFVEDLYSKSDKARMFLGDENWKVAKSSTMMRSFQESIKRLARKYGFFNVNATQGGLDYAPFPSFLAAVKNNTFGYIIPGAMASDVDQLCSFYGWGEAIRKQLKEEVGLKETDDGLGGKRKSFGRALLINVTSSNDIESVLIDNVLTKTEFEIYHSDAQEGRIHTFYKKVKGLGINERIKKIRSLEYAFDDELLQFLIESDAQRVIAKIREIRKRRDAKSD